MKSLSFLVLFILITIRMTAQEKIVIPAFERAKKETSTLSYKATLLTKKFGRNDFKTKRFEVFARRNEGQNDYRFDWEIIERMDGGEQIFIFLPSVGSLTLLRAQYSSLLPC